LQMPWNPNNFDTPMEGPDQVAGFESVVKKLTDDGVIDPARVGAIGFSRSVYHASGNYHSQTPLRCGFGDRRVTLVTSSICLRWMAAWTGRPMQSTAASVRRRGPENWLAPRPNSTWTKYRHRCCYWIRVRQLWLRIGSRMPRCATSKSRWTSLCCKLALAPT